MDNMDLRTYRDLICEIEDVRQHIAEFAGQFTRHDEQAERRALEACLTDLTSVAGMLAQAQRMNQRSFELQLIARRIEAGTATSDDADKVRDLRQRMGEQA